MRLCFIALFVCLGFASGGQSYRLTPADTKLLDEIERASVQYFWEAADPNTGLVKDRSKASGPDPRRIGSIAATGFGLTGLCIAHERNYLPRREIKERVRRTLQFLSGTLSNEHGFYYHFVDIQTGERAWKCELSTIDTALLLAGVLTCRQYFDDSDIRDLSRKIYERVDFKWMLTPDNLLSHGWKPESGFLKAKWAEYCEHMLLYLLAIGSPTHPIPASTWHAWSRPGMEYHGLDYINPRASLFVHQFSHAWIDFRNQRDQYANYFENSVLATKAHRAFCLDLSARFPQYSDNLWGITASDSIKGYRAWGGPPEIGKPDGTIVPCAAGGSLPFLPTDTLKVLHNIRDRYGEKAWVRYGFVDAFNPHTNWYNPDVIGIDVGITLLMAENLRTEFVWKTFVKNPEIRKAMKLAGFRRSLKSSNPSGIRGE